MVHCCKQENVDDFSDFLNVLHVGVPTEPCCDPVLIVGAGLSAADAVIAARFRSLPILHVFRKKAAALSTGSTQLPENMYPEYHKVSVSRVG
jgi:hypothetical protein